MSSADLDARFWCLLSSSTLSLDDAMRFAAGPETGAVAAFVGAARVGSSVTPDKPVVLLEYEAYEPMANELLNTIAAEMLAAHAVERIALFHRTGAVAIGDAAIVVVASARHRAAAFDACRAAVEEIKRRLPVWKKERYADGAQWIGKGA